MANAANFDRVHEKLRRERRRKGMHLEKLERLERLLTKREVRPRQRKVELVQEHA